jgi:polar amino acid transport system substrate-binding protein
MKTRVVNSDRELFDLLENDIVDLVVISRINALTLRGEGAGDGIRTVEPPIESFPLYHYLHRKNQHLAPRLTAALKAMEKEGFIQRVRARFIAEMEGRSRGDTQ